MWVAFRQQAASFILWRKRVFVLSHIWCLDQLRELCKEQDDPAGCYWSEVTRQNCGNRLSVPQPGWNKRGMRNLWPLIVMQVFSLARTAKDTSLCLSLPSCRRSIKIPWRKKTLMPSKSAVSASIWLCLETQLLRKNNGNPEQLSSWSSSCTAKLITISLYLFPAAWPSGPKGNLTERKKA